MDKHEAKAREVYLKLFGMSVARTREDKYAIIAAALRECRDEAIEEVASLWVPQHTTEMNGIERYKQAIRAMKAPCKR